MKNQGKLIPFLCIGAVVISLLVSGYVILRPNEQAENQNEIGLAPLVNGRQVIAMTVNSVSYVPNYFKVKVGVPVKWEMTASGQPGCASGVVVSQILPGGSAYLNPNQGQVTVVEFTPQKPGKYSFSCPMNMARGTIEVIN